MKRRQYTFEELQWLKSNYQILGAKICAQKLNRTINSIRGVANKRLKIKIPQSKLNELHSEASQLSFRPAVNEEQFINVDKPEAAYLLGLLWADGWLVTKNSFSVDIKLVEADMSEIEWIFKKTGEWKKYVNFPLNRKPTIQLRASNRRLVNYLSSMNYNVKSWHSAENILNTIPDHLKHYWWRGYLDGDGCICSGKPYVIQFSSGFDQDWSFLPKEIPFRIWRQKTEKSGASKAVISLKEYTIKFGEYIYKGAEQDKIYLPRKFKLFQKMKERANQSEEKKWSRLNERKYQPAH